MGSNVVCEDSKVCNAVFASCADRGRHEMHHWRKESGLLGAGSRVLHCPGWGNGVH
jgi:hypothetical protein